MSEPRFEPRTIGHPNGADACTVFSAEEEARVVAWFARERRKMNGEPEPDPVREIPGRTKR